MVIERLPYGSAVMQLGEEQIKTIVVRFVSLDTFYTLYTVENIQTYGLKISISDP